MHERLLKKHPAQFCNINAQRLEIEATNHLRRAPVSIAAEWLGKEKQRKR